jgi:hypothetical protein
VADSSLAAEVDQHFADNPNYTFYAFIIRIEGFEYNVFGVITKNRELMTFECARSDDDLEAEDVAAWFNQTEEGQDTVAEILTRLENDERELNQPHDSLALMAVSRTLH